MLKDRKEEEELFIRGMWGLINPKNYEAVDRDSLLEFLKLMFDPYYSIKQLLPLFDELTKVMHEL